MKTSDDSSGVKTSIHHAKIISQINLFWPTCTEKFFKYCVIIVY